MLVPLLTGLLASTCALILRLLKGKPDWLEEFTQLALILAMSFIDGFMIAYLAQFLPAFIARLSFHLFLYMLFASLTITLYASYKVVKDVRVYAVAMSPWFFILALIIASGIMGTNLVFFF